MPNLINSGYDEGTSYTRTQGNPYTLPPSSGIDDFFTTMVKRRQPLAARAAAPRATARPYIPPAREGVSGKPEWMDELEKLKAFDQYEATLRGAATRPTGLGAQMIPGMAVDERLLPSRLRAQNAVGGQLFPDAMESKAAPSPTVPSGVGSLGGQYGSGARIETGLDYMSPAERARWTRLLGQA